MDLFEKLGLHLLSWEENMKEFMEEENRPRHLKEGILKNGESVLLLETKKLNDITHENFIWIHHFLINQPFNFINLKYVLLKEDKDLFFAYEKVGQTLTDYLDKTDLNLEVRLLIFKQAVEIVYYLISLDENFTQFDFNLFFIEINSIHRLPILRLIPHCDFFNKAKNQNSGEFSSKNYFYWLFYLQFLIFKENSDHLNSIGNQTEAKFITEDIKLLANILMEIISDNNSKNLMIENLIQFINCILKKFKIREIKMDIKPNNFFRNSVNDEQRKNSNFRMTPNIPVDYNLIGSNKATVNSHQFNNLPNHNIYMNMNNPNVGNLNTSSNITNNLNNSQINYHQYFQFFNNNTNYNNFSFIPYENYPVYMDSNSGNQNIPRKLVYSTHPTQDYFNPNMANIMNHNSMNQPLHNLNYINELNLVNNNAFYRNGINQMSQSNGTPVWNNELIRNMNDSLSMSNHNSFYQLKKNKLISDVLNSSQGRSFRSTNCNGNANNQEKYLNSSLKENQELFKSKSNSSNITTNNANNSTSNVVFSVENFLNDKQEKTHVQPAYDNVPRVKRFNCENDAVIIMHEINNIPIRFDIVIDKKILSAHKMKETTGSDLEINYTASIQCNTSNNKIDNNYLLIPENSKANEGDECKLNNKRKRSEAAEINPCINPSKEVKQVEFNSSNKKIRKITRSPNDKFLCLDNYQENDYNYPNQKSSLLTFHNLDEKDLEMIKSIDNPRRKRGKKKKAKEKEKIQFFNTETNQSILNDFINYMPNFEGELCEHLKSRSHQFMNKNFPEMYNVENFYIHIKLIKEKREAKLKSLVTQIHQIEIKSEKVKSEDSKKTDNEFKMVWDCKKLEALEVDNFLFLIEKQWPLADYIWSQESALEFLSINHYDTKKTIHIIKNNLEEFTIFLDFKRLNTKFHTHVNIENETTSKRRIRYK